MTVLLVEDETHRLREIKKHLQESSLTVLTAENGQQARKILLKNKVDLILCDVNMPYEDGLALAQKVKSDSVMKSIKFFLYSSRRMMEDTIDIANIFGVDKCLESIETKAISAEVINLMNP